MKLKYKDFVVIIFLSGVLVYAACRRNNILPLKKMESPATESVLAGQWQDTIEHRNFRIIAHPEQGLMVYHHDGRLLAGLPGVRAGALRLDAGYIMGNDTIDLLWCRSNDTADLPCFRILDDGSLAVVEI